MTKQDINTVKAALSVELNVTCPDCGHYFDLVCDTNLNDEGELLNEAMPATKTWSSAHDNFECSAICPHCSLVIDIKGIDW